MCAKCCPRLLRVWAKFSWRKCGVQVTILIVGFGFNDIDLNVPKARSWKLCVTKRRCWSLFMNLWSCFCLFRPSRQLLPKKRVSLLTFIQRISFHWFIEIYFCFGCFLDQTLWKPIVKHLLRNVCCPLSHKTETSWLQCVSTEQEWQGSRVCYDEQIDVNLNVHIRHCFSYLHMLPCFSKASKWFHHSNFCPILRERKDQTFTFYLVFFGVSNVSLSFTTIAQNIIYEVIHKLACIGKHA